MVLIHKFIKTKDSKIFISQSEGLDIDKLSFLIKDLERYAKIGNDKKIRSTLAKHIKSFPKT